MRSGKSLALSLTIILLVGQKHMCFVSHSHGHFLGAFTFHIKVGLNSKILIWDLKQILVLELKLKIFLHSANGVSTGPT